MATLIYENSIGVRLELGNSKPILLEAIEGASDLKNNITISNNIGSDGSNVVNEHLESREISIQVAILGKDHLENQRIRSMIISVFNPKLAGKLIYKDRNIERITDIKIENSPKFTKILRGKAQRCIIDMMAPSTFWQDTIETGETIATFIGGWKFKFKLPFRFKQKGEPKKNIYNDGHVETPVEIIFKGPAVNPSIINHATGEFIKVERTLTSDDTLYITTEFGNKKVEIERNGMRQNAFHYIDLDSTFFQLQPGDNMIEYTTDNNLDPQSVEIRYRNRYIGV